MHHCISWTGNTLGKKTACEYGRACVMIVMMSLRPNIVVHDIMLIEIIYLTAKNVGILETR